MTNPIPVIQGLTATPHKGVFAIEEFTYRTPYHEEKPAGLYLILQPESDPIRMQEKDHFWHHVFFGLRDSAPFIGEKGWPFTWANVKEDEFHYLIKASAEPLVTAQKLYLIFDYLHSKGINPSIERIYGLEHIVTDHYKGVFSREDDRYISGFVQGLCLLSAGEHSAWDISDISRGTMDILKDTKTTIRRSQNIPANEYENDWRRNFVQYAIPKEEFEKNMPESGNKES